MSTTSTADGEDDVASSPVLPLLAAPRLSERAQVFLRHAQEEDDEEEEEDEREDEDQFGTASWGSPYPRADRNLRQQSFSGSDISDDDEDDDLPIHHLAIDTPFLRQPSYASPTASINPAAEVLANRARRQVRPLTEDWIRAHTTGDLNNIEPQHWFSDGSGSEHSSLSGSETGWFDDRDPRTPKPPRDTNRLAPRQPRAPRTTGSSSIDTLKPGGSSTPRRVVSGRMAVSDNDVAVETPVMERSESQEEVPRPGTPPKEASANEETKLPATPSRLKDKPLPKDPPVTPRIKKKVPWKGKNIMVLLPRDDERGLPGKAPKPLRQHEIERMFASWEELGYPVSGFDLLPDDHHPTGLDDSQSRDEWPAQEDMNRERAEQSYQVTLPDLNAWGDYVKELQEAKLRALGVFQVEEEPPAPPSPPMTNPSRQPSAQLPSLPFSPPLPTSSASSNVQGFPFNYGPPAAQSPGIPAVASPISFNGAPGKFNSRQSISFPSSNSPFQMGQQPQWIPGMQRSDSPSMANLNGMMSPQSPFGMEGMLPTGSPAFNLPHQRHQSLQYPMLPHQQLQQQQYARASPRLQEVREDEEEEYAHSPSKTPEPQPPNPDNLQAEIDDAEYHLEESMRNQLEHEDYNPQVGATQFANGHQPSESVHERFANNQEQPPVLHHPRPHSRGHSLSQNFFRDHNQAQGSGDDQNLKGFVGLNEIPEGHRGDESYEIETNPSNLGTPIQNFQLPAYGHQHASSSNSNPWNESTAHGRQPSHESKPSLSKLNVQAPEFKFNPTSTFTPGALAFSSAAFQPASVFQATVEPTEAHLPEPPSEEPSFASGPQANFEQLGGEVHEFTGSANKDNSPSFAPAKSIFSFSTTGPTFRPDAPAFTPFQASDKQPVLGHGNNRDSIFGNIRITASDVVKPAKKSKAIPIIRPVTGAAGNSPQATESEDPNEHRIDNDRVKRVRNQAPDADDVPLFAEQPSEPFESQVPDMPEQAYEEENTLPVDTSMSSAITSDQVDTKATTAAPSESSPVEIANNQWRPFEFDSKYEAKNFSEAQPFRDFEYVRGHKKSLSVEFDSKYPHGHKKSLSAAAPTFTPGAASFGSAKDAPNAEEATPTPADRSAETTEPEPEVDVLAASPPAPPSVPYESASEAETIQKKSSQGLGASRFASPPPKPKGLAASRFAAEPSPEPVAVSVEQESEPLADAKVSAAEETHTSSEEAQPVDEPTLADIDAVMEQLQKDPSKGVNRAVEQNVIKPGPLTDVKEFSAYQLEPPLTDRYARNSTSRSFAGSAAPPVLEDPFRDPAISPRTPNAVMGDTNSAIISDWEGAFSEDEHAKLHNRAQFFDNRVNEVVGNLLASRLGPLEKSLVSIHEALALKASRATSPSRRDMRSASGENQQSDADDEDEEPGYHRSMSPRRDRKLEQIRAAVLDGFAAHQRAQPAMSATEKLMNAELLNSIEELKEQFASQQKVAQDEGEKRVSEEKAEPYGEDLKELIEAAVLKGIPAAPSADEQLLKKMEEMQNKMDDLQDRLHSEQEKVEKEISARRAAEDSAAELNRHLQAAETRVEVEVINRTVFDQRVTDLEERLRHQEHETESEVNNRRAAEDKLAENQRLLKVSMEEEHRLHEAVEERDQKLRQMEQANGKVSMKMALLEAAQNNSTQSQSEMTNKLNVLETDLRNVRQDNNHWRSEAERADEAARRNAGERDHAVEENKHLHKSLTTLTTQLEENERLRESWRAKFMSLQNDMSRAAREIAEDNAHRIKKDQAMFARQEVLDARLQAEAKTRERLEVEMERLQMNERSGMRATNECKRLEGILGDLRTENHKLQQRATEAQREFEEARESGAIEVKRTRMAMQNEIDAANHQVNTVRIELEEQVSRLRSELENFKMDADTAKERSEMLLEDAQTSKAAELDDLRAKHQNELEDLQARWERQRTTSSEEAHKSEQNLLERLSLSSSRMEHLQDRVYHLEEKLEISRQAAAAAAAAAKSAGVDAGPAAETIAQSRSTENRAEVPEKISPQALRESIMVLQEQLQAREQRIEELEQTNASLDPDAATKITKRDDEITWLRELLSVRHGELQDIIASLQKENFDRGRVRNAVIRLKANMQMEQQERERAMNGGGAGLNLPNLAQTIQSASPRVAQAVGPLAAAWGNWRRGTSGSVSSNTSKANTPTVSETPSKSTQPQQNSPLGGLMTPPASNVRQYPIDNRPQPTAFSNTGRRYPSHGSTGSSSRPRGSSSISRQGETPQITEPFPAPQEQVVEEEEPMTPPMMHPHVYDDDAQPGDFDDDGFFEEED